jgi:hypothetical protein
LDRINGIFGIIFRTSTASLYHLFSHPLFLFLSVSSQPKLIRTSNKLTRLVLPKNASSHKNQQILSLFWGPLDYWFLIFLFYLDPSTICRSYPSTICRSYPSTICRSYGAGGAGWILRIYCCFLNSRMELRKSNPLIVIRHIAP